MRPFLFVAAPLLLAGCGMVNARVIDKNGNQYDLDGTPREAPAARAKDAMTAMRACTQEVARAQSEFTKTAVPAVLAVSSAAGGSAAIVFADADPLVRVDATASAKTKAKAARARSGDSSSFQPATDALSASLRSSLDATDHCSAASLDAVKVLFEEQRYISQAQTRELLESHWRATQSLARAKELGVTTIALGLAVADAGRGKGKSLSSMASRLSGSDPLFVDVAFDHDLRREVLLQERHDTSCGKPDENGKTKCDEIFGAFKSVQAVAGAVNDVQKGRVLEALEKASNLSDGGASQEARENARREAVIALIAETPAGDRLGAVLDRARAGRSHDARALGTTLASSDGVAKLLESAEK